MQTYVKNPKEVKVDKSLINTGVYERFARMKKEREWLSFYPSCLFYTNAIKSTEAFGQEEAFINYFGTEHNEEFPIIVIENPVEEELREMSYPFTNEICKKVEIVCSNLKFANVEVSLAEIDKTQNIHNKHPGFWEESYKVEEGITRKIAKKDLDDDYLRKTKHLKGQLSLSGVMRRQNEYNRDFERELQSDLSKFMAGQRGYSWRKLREEAQQKYNLSVDEIPNEGDLRKYYENVFKNIQERLGNIEESYKAFSKKLEKLDGLGRRAEKLEKIVEKQFL